MIAPRTAVLIPLYMVLFVAEANALQASYAYGYCDVQPNKNYNGPQVSGQVMLKQKVIGGFALGNVEINVDLTGFDPSGSGQHGFHVHEYGDLSNGCQSTGGHYNPFNKNHGDPSASERHVGDLGNIVMDFKGNVEQTIVDKVVTLQGRYSIYGRAIVVHELRDDLGLGGNEGSRTTGNAGARMACCIIGVSPGPAA
ncbi:uncharacterized protein LOC144452504 [Glandiceps talaboti]